jgi:hypothetical protein
MIVFSSIIDMLLSQSRVLAALASITSITRVPATNLILDVDLQVGIE